MIKPPRWVRLTTNRQFFPVRCTECYWQGCSSQTFGGGPLADTGDYCDIECPKCCSTELDTDYVWDVFNPLYWILHWLKRPVFLYEQHRFAKAMLRDYEAWQKEKEKQ